MAKKRKDFDGDPGSVIGEVIYSVIKPIHKEGEKIKRRRRANHTRKYYTSKPKVTQKDIVFAMLPQGIRNAGENFSRRDLNYATRPLVYNHPAWEKGEVLNYDYFSQGLLVDYQKERGLIPGLWTEARGHFQEPHTGKVIGLGTREVLAYVFPKYTFNKILYVEKEGEWSKLRAAKLAERFDMGLASAKGYPVEAVRELFARAEAGDHQLFVFHDADPDGYNIVWVMREATRRMPHHNVEVIDIGLTVEDALEMNLDSEPFSRKKAIPHRLHGRLSTVAEEYFVVRRERFELNAILPDTRRIEYIERKLEEAGVRPKVIPPDDALKELGEGIYREKVGGWVEEAIAELLDTDELKERVAEELKERFGLENAREWIEEGFEIDRSKSWKDVLDEKLDGSYRAEYEDELHDAVHKCVREGVSEREVEEQGDQETTGGGGG
jgi:hypothetical protein